MADNNDNRNGPQNRQGAQNRAGNSGRPASTPLTAQQANRSGAHNRQGAHQRNKSRIINVARGQTSQQPTAQDAVPPIQSADPVSVTPTTATLPQEAQTMPQNQTPATPTAVPPTPAQPVSPPVQQQADPAAMVGSISGNRASGPQGAPRPSNNNGKFIPMMQFYHSVLPQVGQRVHPDARTLAKMALLSAQNPAKANAILAMIASGELDANNTGFIDDMLHTFRAAQADVAASAKTGRSFDIVMPTASGSYLLPEEMADVPNFMQHMDDMQLHAAPYKIEYRFDNNSHTEFDGQNYKMFVQPEAQPEDLRDHGVLMLEQLKAAGHDTVSFNGQCSPAFVDAIMNAYAMTDGIELDGNSLANAGLSPQHLAAAQQRLAAIQATRQTSQPNAPAQQAQQPAGSLVGGAAVPQQQPQQQPPANNQVAIVPPVNAAGQTTTPVPATAVGVTPTQTNPKTYWANTWRAIQAAALTGILAVMMFGNTLGGLLPDFKKDKSDPANGGGKAPTTQIITTPAPEKAPEKIVKKPGSSKHKQHKDAGFERGTNDQADVYNITNVYQVPTNDGGYMAMGDNAEFQQEGMGGSGHIMNWSDANAHFKENKSTTVDITQGADTKTEYSAKEVAKMQKKAMRHEL